MVDRDFGQNCRSQCISMPPSAIVTHLSVVVRPVLHLMSGRGLILTILLADWLCRVLISSGVSLTTLLIVCLLCLFRPFVGAVISSF